MPIAEILKQEGFFAVLLLGVGIGFLLNMAFGSRDRDKTAQTRVMGNGTVQAGSFPPVQSSVSATNPRLVAAITAAVNEYRKNNA